MKLIVTADLHYNITRSIEPTRQIADEICGLRADGLLILGDAAGRDVSILRDCLDLFDRFDGRKFFVAGNHDIWINPGESSVDRLERVLPGICEDAGFHALDLAPAVLDSIGLVGSIGWYDFSFRPAWLGVPLRFYRAKIAPGAAERHGGCEELLADTSDIPERAMQIGSRWMDGRHVRLDMSDLDFCQYLLDRLTRHLDQLAPTCRQIVVGLHHLPFWELVPRNPIPNWAFASAFLGSELFGDLLLTRPEVTHVFTGHTHRHVHARVGHIDCTDVGSTYVAKRYEILEL